MTSPFLDLPHSARVASNALAFAVRDRFPVSPGHTLVIPRRLVATWFDATAEERAAVFALVDEVKARLDAGTPKPDGYNIGINAGPAAGQTVMHLHVHVIPRYAGDVDDPRGGVRHVIPGKGNYCAEPAPPLSRGGPDDPFSAHLRPALAPREPHRPRRRHRPRAPRAVPVLRPQGRRRRPQHPVAQRAYRPRGTRARRRDRAPHAAPVGGLAGAPGRRWPWPPRVSCAAGLVGRGLPVYRANVEPRRAAFRTLPDAERLPPAVGGQATPADGRSASTPRLRACALQKPGSCGRDGPRTRPGREASRWSDARDRFVHSEH